MDREKLYLSVIGFLVLILLTISAIAYSYSENVSDLEEENKVLNDKVGVLSSNVSSLESNITELTDEKEDVVREKEDLENDVGHFRESALVAAEALGWAVDGDQVVYRFSVENYGDFQADDVAVSCGIYNEDNELISSQSVNVDNVASNSIDVFNHESSDLQSNSLDDTMSCSVGYCENCVKLEHNLDTDYIKEKLEQEGFWSPIEELTA